jgi:hypothetical protein
MSKADTLLKRATFFERMALYSDRKAFLRALAQDGQWPADKGLPPDIAQGLNSLMKDLAATKPESSAALQNQLADFYQGTNKDMGQLAQAIRNAANTIPGDHTTQVQNALALAAKVDQLVASQQPQQQQEDAAGGTMVMPAAHIKGFAPISKTDQEAVFNFVGRQGQIDGQLGPETRKALNEIKAYFAQKNPQNKQMSDQQAIQAAVFHKKFPQQGQ